MKNVKTDNILLELRCGLAEGVVWSGDSQSLFWVDITNNKLYRYQTEESKLSYWKTPSTPVNIFLFDKPDILMVSLDVGLFLFDIVNELWKEWMLIETENALTRINDGGVDRRNRMWLGTMQNNFLPDGSSVKIGSMGKLYSILPSRLIKPYETEVGISNTLVFSPNYKHLYFADSLIRKMYRYDYNEDSGELFNKCVYADYGDSLGDPDGSATDEEVFVWNARWDAGIILRINPEGIVDMKLDLPTSRPTNVCFGGKDYRILFITTAQYGLNENKGGYLYTYEAPVRGMQIPLLSSSIYQLG